MSATDSLQLLAEHGSRLDAVHAQAELRLALQFDLVDQADRGAHELLDELEARYLAGDGDSDAAEQSQVWGRISLYWAQMEAAYLHLIRQFETYSQGWAEMGERMPTVAARAMRATSARLKWQLMRYLPVEQEIWQTLSQLWALVEDKGMGQVRVLVYDDQSTLPREFLKPMMLAVCAADSLRAVEVDIASRIIDYLSERFELQRHPAKTCNYFIDIDQWTPPERYKPLSEVRFGARFFGAGRLKGQLDGLIAKLSAGGSAPPEMKLQGIGDMAAVTHVLEHLTRHWWEQRRERRGERRRSGLQIGVAHGYDAIMACLSSGETDAQMRAAAETWVVDDESDDGYGAVLPKGQGDWLHVGRVLAMKPSGTRVWVVGVVRRLAAQEGGQRNVGIELLARGARPVSLHRISDSWPICDALLLPPQSGGNAALSEVRLLLPSGRFLPEARLEMEAYGNRYFLEPRRLLEKGNEFEIARYRILQRAA